MISVLTSEGSEQLILINTETKKQEIRNALQWNCRSSHIFCIEYHRVRLNIVKIFLRMENIAVYWHELPIASMPDPHCSLLI